MGISKPSWLVWFLDGLNYSLYIPPWDVGLGFMDIADKGEWLSLHLNIGDWIETAIDATLGAIDAAIAAIVELIPDFWDIFDVVAGAYRAVIEAVDFVQGWTLEKIQDVYEVMSWDVLAVYDFIEETRRDLMTFAADAAVNVYTGLLAKIPEMIDDQVGNVLTEIRDQVNIVSEYRDEIVEIFSDPLEWLYNKITAMVERFW